MRHSIRFLLTIIASTNREKKGTFPVYYIFSVVHKFSFFTIYLIHRIFITEASFQKKMIYTNDVEKEINQ